LVVIVVVIVWDSLNSATFARVEITLFWHEEITTEFLERDHYTGLKIYNKINASLSITGEVFWITDEDHGTMY
jgi:hypothetical protein